MACFLNNKTLKLLDDKIDIYLVYLVHIQQSINISLNEKIDAFNQSEFIGNEIHAITEKIINSNINSFNENDFEAFISNNLNSLIQGITEEITHYDKKLNFNFKEVFSIRDVIQKLVEPNENTVYLTRDKIDRLLSYKRLYINKKDEELDKEINQEMEVLKKKLDDDFENIRYKTFQSFIRGVNHKNEDYWYKTNRYILQNYMNRTFAFISDYQEDTKGIFFIQSKSYDIGILIDEDNIRIEYFLGFNKNADTINLRALGYIKHVDSKVDFYIDESYSNGLMDSVLNTFNIVPIIQKFNDSYVEYFHAKVKDESAEDKAKKEIDDFFSGKII